MANRDKLHIDIETFSSVDIKKAGHYKYMESHDFEILMAAYALNDEPVKRVDLYNEGGMFPEEFLELYNNPDIEKWAHNATFERNAFNTYGMKRPTSEWYCSAIKAAYSGFPLGLDAVSKAMGLGDKAKSGSGKALIRYFSIPCRPTKTNGGRTRNLPHHDPEKWEQFIRYMEQDVEAEREIERLLRPYKIPDFERRIYLLDQKINDTGIGIDTDMAKTALGIVKKNQEVLGGEIKEITGVYNPNSPAQLKEWLSNAEGKEINTLAKDEIPKLIEASGSEAVKQVLELRSKASKTSNKKYAAMLNCVCKDGRGHGFFQHYGAMRTGRWAGRIVQLQNLPRNYLKDLDVARQLYKEGNYDNLSLFFDNIPDVLSQLIRTAFVAPQGKTFVISDFSAIEARVIAWLAGEQWRLDVFNSHGKIYEASAAMMFDIPMEQITKGSEWRQKGKVAELALGYGGSVGAVKQMAGTEEVGSDEEIQDIVNRWRAKSPNIVKLWRALENGAKAAMKKAGKTITLTKYQNININIKFKYDGKILLMRLPSGRCLSYVKPRLTKNRFGGESIKYQGMDQTTKKWTWIETYGGKLSENCLAGNTKVLTLNGIKKITSVNKEDKLWDGYKWVSHDGLVSKGVNTTINVNGIRMTPDHKILTEYGWKNASQSKGLNRAKVQLPNGFRIRRLGRKEFTLESEMCMWQRKNNGSLRTSKEKNKILRVQTEGTNRKSKQYSRNDKPSCLRGLEINDGQMQVTHTPSLAQLRRKRYSGLQKMGEVREFLGGYGRRLQTGTDYRAQRCERQLQQKELQVGHYESSSQEQKTEYSNKHQMGVCNGSRSRREIRDRKHDHTLPNKSGLAGRKITHKAGLHEPVYDILNSGDLHRFTVIDGNGEPMIVHNCVQAVARDLLVESMLALDKAGYNIVMHVHDEVVIEVPESEAEEKLKDVERIMSLPIEWAAGLPVNADGYISPYYKKD